MDQFEKNSDDIEVRTAYMEGTMASSTATSTPEDEVDRLIKMVADENNLELGEAFKEVGPIGTKVPEPEKEKPETSDLEARLANLSRG